ncbi:zinc finger dihydrouridine synthase [Pseudohyphozyma bogoriensis]|nr:zinc finger dihydrouridine synthase [Pseudohyphozyma bogoriensis]
MADQQQPAADSAPAADVPYYDAKPGVAAIKPEYVLWEKMRHGQGSAVRVDDDAAEARGRGAVAQKTPRDERPPDAESTTSTPAPATTDAPAEASSSTLTHSPPSSVAGQVDGADGEPPAKKVRLSGAQKKAAARARSEAAWQAKKAEKQAAKEAKAEGGEGAGGGRVKQNGQNKGRMFNNRAGVNIKLCTATAQFRDCTRGPQGCRWSHDLKAYLDSREPDVPISLPTSDNSLDEREESARACPLYELTGECPFGVKCRFGASHLKKLGEGEGFQGCGWELMVDEEKQKKWAELKKEGLSERGELNVVVAERIRAARGVGLAKEDRYPLTTAYLLSIGEPLDIRDAGGENNRKKDANNGKGNKRGGRNLEKKEGTEDAGAQEKTEEELSKELEEAAERAEEEAAAASMQVEQVAETTTTPAKDPDARPDVDLSLIRNVEKKRLDFRGKLYMAPLTTVGNLPFRRLAGDFGNDISISEMGLSQEFLNGNGNEWSLVRRHPSEKLFGVQICGSRPQTLVPAAEAIAKTCDIDFLDINCGCPIDLVFNKGAGSALLGHASKLGKSLVGMSKVLGEIPLTIKIRNGISHNAPVAHKLVTKMQTEWGVSAVTLHGRSRQQRYKTKADYAYIGQVVKTLRETAADNDLQPIPIFGNGDAYDFRTYYENTESSGVDGIMIARGALVKPWIFTEIKERRDWDISSRERLDMIGKLVNYGLEHWGSDTQGLNTTRRFLLESLSFQHRYVPVGLLERLPASLNDRAYPYKGRDELETLLASDQSVDWIKISNMFLGPPPDDWSFAPKHKSNAQGDSDAQG